jgi:hypothetical protein
MIVNNPINQNIDEMLIESAESALDNFIPKSLMSASIEINNKEIQWLCVFDLTATEEDIEFGSVAGTEIIADFSHEFGINEMLEKTESSIKVRCLKNLIYTRKDL